MTACVWVGFGSVHGTRGQIDAQTTPACKCQDDNILGNAVGHELCVNYVALCLNDAPLRCVLIVWPFALVVLGFCGLWFAVVKSVLCVWFARQRSCMV